ncbi:MAG: hypothetical protein RIG68_12410 [Imperialibacter sp.]|uniref:hypothetical protein n=1 Tax=Imperialibacter sp. TaxID=2038411 RepID=UPI0032F03915
MSQGDSFFYRKLGDKTFIPKRLFRWLESAADYKSYATRSEVSGTPGGTMGIKTHRPFQAFVISGKEQ